MLFYYKIILSRIVGARATLGFGVASLILYLVMQNSVILPFDFYYKNLLVYFFFYIMATRIRPTVSFNNFLLVLALLFLAGEIYLYIYLDYYPGFYFSTIILTYLILKQSPDVQYVGPERYLFFAYLYPYKLIYILLRSVINASPLVITIITVLVTFILGQLLYKLKVKFLDYTFIGIH